MNYIKNRIEYLESIRNKKELWKCDYQIELEILRDIQKRFKLRR